MMTALAGAGRYLTLPVGSTRPENLWLARPLTAFVMLALLFAGFWLIPRMAHAQDAGGADTLAADPGSAVNFAWTLLAGALVFFMQAGFALLGAGLIRSKNTVSYMTKGFMGFAAASLAYWAFGFAFMFGGAGGFGLETGGAFIGGSGFFLAGDAYDVSTITRWFFQVVLAATAAAIVAGAVAERMKLTAYLAFSFVLAALIYPIYGHWVWGGGWLGSLEIGETTGLADFAGSGVVHAVAGIAALMGAAAVGPRLGRFKADGTPNRISGHNVPFAVIGTFILFFGWFGFNAGNAVAATDLRISVIIANTLLAGAAGALVALYWTIFKTGKADLPTACRGALAGLVGITAGCAFVAPWAAVVIGALAIPVMFGTTYVVERILRVDDVIGAVSVHGGAGLWGVLAVGIFADGSYGVSGFVDGNGEQFMIQIIGVLALVGWVVVTAGVMFWALNKTMGLRASREEELGGLDVPEHGMEAYPAEESLTDLMAEKAGS